VQRKFHSIETTDAYMLYRGALGTHFGAVGTNIHELSFELWAYDLSDLSRRAMKQNRTTTGTAPN
jgi:hypothetical protein